MSKSVQIHIPQPCHENWQNMTSKEQGRFCGSCKKVVVDFSKMSDKEMLDHISKAAGQSVCGRFANDQLNRKIEAAANKPRISLAYAWNLLLAAGLLLTESCKQQTTLGVVLVEKNVEADKGNRSNTVVPPVIEKEPQPLFLIKGRVVDFETGSTVKGASVRIAGAQRNALTNVTGEFSLLSVSRDSVTLEVSAEDYGTRTVKLDNKSDWEHVKVNIAKEYIMGFTVMEKIEDPIWLKQQCFDKIK